MPFPAQAASPRDAMVFVANTFTALSDFQITSGERVALKPLLSADGTLPISPNLDEEDIDEEFISALGTIHHNPHINFDANMFVCSFDEETISDNSKRRKREDLTSSGFHSPSP